MQLWLSKLKSCGRFLLIVFAFSAARFALASPATFITALPVAENQTLTRFNWDPIFSGQDLTNFQFPFDLAYGLNARWTLFATLNPMYNSIETQTPSGSRAVSSGGRAIA